MHRDLDRVKCVCKTMPLVSETSTHYESTPLLSSLSSQSAFTSPSTLTATLPSASPHPSPDSTMRRASSDAAFPRVVSYSRLDCWLSDNPDDGAVEVNPYAHTNHSNSSNGGMGTGIGTNSKTNLHTNNSIHSTVVQGPSKSLHRKRTLSNVPRVAHAASYGIAAVTGDSRRVWFRLAWICHFGLLAIVLLVSVLNNPNSRYVTYTSFNDTPTNALFTSNTKSYSHVHRTLGLGDRKYVPIHASDSSGTGDCQKAFVNVMADSLQEPDALICCRNDGLFTGICPSKVSGLQE